MRNKKCKALVSAVSIMISLLVLVTSVFAAPSVSNVAITGAPSSGGFSGATLSATGTFQDADLSKVKYQWYYSMTANGTAIPIYKAISKDYYVNTDDRARYLKVGITPVDAQGVEGQETVSGSVYVTQLGPTPRTTFDAATIATHVNTPVANIFSVGGKSFILLDDFQDDNSKFYILAYNTYGTKVFDPDNTQKFDVTDTNNMGYFLQNDFITSGNGGQKLPQEILNYINYNHVWNTEAGHGSGACPNDFAFTAGISLISRGDATEYQTRFGYQDSITNAGWWLRTARNNNVNAVFSYIGLNDGGKGNTWDRNANDTNQAIRPCFFLKRDFFLNVKLNISSIGQNVKNTIKSIYTKEELLASAAGYTEQELVLLGYPIEPVAERVDVIGNVGEGEMIEGTYIFKDLSGKGEGTSKFKWAQSNTLTGTYTEISGATSKDYSIPDGSAGKYIKFGVVPVDTINTQGKAAWSDPYLIALPAEIVVKKVDFTDGVNPITTLAGKTQVTPKVTIRNNGTGVKTVVLWVGAYNSEHTLMKNIAVKKSINPNSTIDITDLSLTGLSYQNGNYVRVTVLDSLTAMNSHLSVLRDIR